VILLETGICVPMVNQRDAEPQIYACYNHKQQNGHPVTYHLGPWDSVKGHLKFSSILMDECWHGTAGHVDKHSRAVFEIYNCRTSNAGYYIRQHRETSISPDGVQFRCTVRTLYIRSEMVRDEAENAPYIVGMCKSLPRRH
jgi:hypothetical protein